MDTNASSFVKSSSAQNSVCYQTEEGDGGFIDLGLSLRTLQCQSYNHQSGHLRSLEGDREDIKWPQSGRQSSALDQRVAAEDYEEDVQSRQRWAFVKVNMDGVMVGRKISILDHAEYATLARQLQHMFGGQSPFSLRLFQPDSEFCIFYKDKEDHWRTVGDVPWKEFVENVKRIRIARK